MHYSKYLRGVPGPVIISSPVEEAEVIDSEVIETEVNEEVVQDQFPEKDPNSIKIVIPPDTPFSAMVQSQEEAAHSLQIPEPKYIDPVVNRLVDLLSSAQDIVTKAKLNKLLDVMFQGLEEKINEPRTILDEYEANRIAQYFIDVEEKYFSDMTICDSELPKSFIWNIPRAMYEDMCKAQDEGVIDVLNPMIYMYIALCGYPGEASARFLKILDDIRYTDTNQFNEYDAKYQEKLDIEAEQSEDEEDEESISETFARNGYAEEDED